MNFAFACRSAASGSMPSLRDRLAIEKSRSPISSSARSGPSWPTACAQLRDLFLDLVEHARRSAAQSKPTAATRVPISYACSSAGSAFGSPRSTDRVVPGVALLARLDLLPLLEDLIRRLDARPTCRTRADGGGSASSQIARSESATVKCAVVFGDPGEEHAFEDEVADLAAQRRRDRRGRSRRAPRRSPRARTGRSDSSVCSRSHGQPPGPRSRAMMSTSSWNASPAERSARSGRRHQASMLAFRGGKRRKQLGHRFRRVRALARDHRCGAVRRHPRSSHRRSAAEPNLRRRRRR